MARLSELAGKSGQAISESLQRAGNGAPLQPVTKALEGVKSGLDGVGASAKTTAQTVGTASSSIAAHFRSVAEAVGGFVVTKAALAELGAVLVKITGTTHAQAEGWSAVGQGAATAYRAIRLALSPTLFTAATLGAGVLLEKLASITNEEGKQLELQSRLAAQRGLRPDDVAAVSLAGGKNSSDLLDLARTAGGNRVAASETLGVQVSGRPAEDLREIARALAAIQDPYQKALAAQRVFGDEAGKALTLLDDRFADNAQRVRDWGLVYSVDARSNILEFRRDLEALAHPFEELGAVIHTSLTQAKTELTSFFAYAYTQLKSGSLAEGILAPFNLKRTGEMLPEGARNFLTADSGVTGGVQAMVEAAIRSGGKRTPDQQLGVELRDNVRARQFTADLVPDEATDIAAVNKQASGTEGFRQSLEALQHRRSQIVAAYYEQTTDGKLKFKDDLSSVQKANANAALLSTNRGISQANSSIDAAALAQQEASRSAALAQAAERSKAGRFQTQLAQARESEIMLGAAGNGANPYARAAAETEKQVAALNNELAKTGQTLSLSERQFIRSVQNTIALNNAEAEWRETVAGLSTTLTTQARAQDVLTAAVGKGAEAARSAAIETQLMESMGGKYGQPGKESDTTALRQRIGAQYDARQRNQSAVQLESLNQETQATLRLAAAQALGAEAVRRQTTENEVAAMVRAGATEAEQKAYRARSEAQRSNDSATNVASLREQAAAAERLLQAEVRGEAATRAAQVQNQITAATRSGATAEEIAALRDLASLQDREQTVNAAGQRLNYISDQVKALREQLAVLRSIQAAEGDSLKMRAAIKDITLQIAQAENAQMLAAGSAADGMRVFFRELTQQGASAAQKVHDVLTSAFEGVNDNLAKIISGQKSSWADFFQSLSEQLAKLAIQEAEMGALRSLGLGGNGNQNGNSGSAGSGGSGNGGILGGLLGGLFKGNSAASRSAANGGTPGFLSDGDDGSDAEDADGGSVASTAISAVGGFFKKLFGGFKAEGGSVDPGRAYVVGEKGPELFTPPGSGGSITPNRMLGGTTNFYNINASDANSADVDQRVNRSLVAVHGSAIRNSAAVQAEMMRRKPRGA